MDSQLVLHKGTHDLINKDYMEFFSGDFVNSVEYWNESSLYLSHSAYKLIHKVFLECKKDYDDYFVNQFKDEELRTLKSRLVKNLSDVTNISSVQEGKRMYSKADFSGGLDVVKNQLMTLHRDLIEKVDESITSNKSFWVLGM